MDTVSESARDSRPLRLLWVIDTLTIGGAEALVLTFADALNQRTTSLEVCCLKSLNGNALEPELRARGISVHNLRAHNLRDVSGFRRLVALMRQTRPHIVHAHLTYASIWSAVACRLTRTPLVATLHVPPTDASATRGDRVRQRVMCTTLKRSASAVVAVSAALEREYVEGGWLPDRLVRVVHNGVDATRFHTTNQDHRALLRSTFNLPPESIVLTTVATLHQPRKGIDVLLRALAAIRARIPAARLLIVGDGPLRGTLERLATSLSIDSIVRFAGVRRDIPEILTGSDVFVFPTRHDPLPTVLLEAMMAGLPVISTEVDGVPEIVEGDDTGILVPPGDVEAFGDAMAALAADAPRRARLGERGRARALTRFSATAWLDRLQQVYADVLPPNLPCWVTAGEERRAS